ncbi:MAG: hypothetical protein ACKPB8_14605, partial [Alphaproteobacteria bacterium]
MDAAESINQKPKIRLNLTPIALREASTLTFYSSLAPKKTLMLSLNFIAAFSHEIAANAGIIQVRSPVQPVDALANNRLPQTSQQRSLEAGPPEPN